MTNKVNRKSTLDILVVSDIHYVGAEAAGVRVPADYHLGRLLLHRAFQKLAVERVKVGLAVVLGDVIHMGLGADPNADLAAIADESGKWDVPVLFVHGNHDCDVATFTKATGTAAGPHEVAGYGFMVFCDRVGEREVTIRTDEGLRLPVETDRINPELPLVALQHNPPFPAIDNEYPYNLANADKVIEGYLEAGVALSLSGHYHPGQPALRVKGLTFYTVPALCESPFRFAHVRLCARQVRITEHALKVD